MFSYCLKCKKNTESIDPNVSATSNGRTSYYQIVLYAVLKNQNLLKARSKRIIK